MKRRIEIEISEALYSELLQAAEEQGCSLQQYIELKIAHETEGKKLAAMKKFIVMELQHTMNKIQALRPEELEMEEKSNRILVYSYQALMQQSTALPQELEDKITFYKEREWLEDRLFYIIISRKRPVGIIGIMPQQEPMPYGDYLHIYGLYLEKALQTKKNLTYLSGYLQAIAKQEKALNIDVSNAATNLSEEQLQEMGFHAFSVSRLVKGKLQAVAPELRIQKIEKATVELEDAPFQEYIMSERTLPLSLLVKGWQKRISSVEVEKVSFMQGSESMSYILIKEKLLSHGNTELKLNILVKPIGVYDLKVMEEIYVNVLTEAAKEGNDFTTVICLPEELKALDTMLKVTSAMAIKWYRSLINGS